MIHIGMVTMWILLKFGSAWLELVSFILQLFLLEKLWVQSYEARPQNQKFEWFKKLDHNRTNLLHELSKAGHVRITHYRDCIPENFHPIWGNVDDKVRNIYNDYFRCHCSAIGEESEKTNFICMLCEGIVLSFQFDMCNTRCLLAWIWYKIRNTGYLIMFK